MNIKLIVQNLLDKMLPHREAPKLAVVEKVYSTSGKGTYACDVTILRAGDFQRTTKKYKKVPINPIWATKNGAGVYAPIEKNMIVVVNFIEWNNAFPYISTVYSKQYDCIEHKDNEFVITNGNGLYIKLIDSDDEKKIDLTIGSTTLNLSGLVELKNANYSLKDIFSDIWETIETLNNLCSTIETKGSPCSHVVVSAPFISQKQNIQIKRSKIETLFK